MSRKQTISYYQKVSGKKIGSLQHLSKLLQLLQISIPIPTLAQNLQPLLMTMECPEGIILQFIS